MTRLTPVSRRVLIQRLHRLGFEGPFSGGRHQFMSRGEIDVHVPNPHEGDISAALLARILRQAGISRKDDLLAREVGFSMVQDPVVAPGHASLQSAIRTEAWGQKIVALTPEDR